MNHLLIKRLSPIHNLLNPLAQSKVLPPRVSCATCPGTRQSAGRRTAACARPATPPRASTASPWTAGPSTARWGTCLTYYIITCTCHTLHTCPGVHRGEHGAVLHCRGVRPGGGHQLRVAAQGGVRGGARAGLQVTRALDT